MWLSLQNVHYKQLIYQLCPLILKEAAGRQLSFSLSNTSLCGPVVQHFQLLLELGRNQELVEQTLVGLYPTFISLCVNRSVGNSKQSSLNHSLNSAVTSNYTFVHSWRTKVNEKSVKSLSVITSCGTKVCFAHSRIVTGQQSRPRPQHKEKCHPSNITWKHDPHLAL